MVHMNLKRNKENFNVNVFYSSNSKSHYGNVLTKDAKRLAQIFIDLNFEGFPIEKAFKIFKERTDQKDWFGF